MFSSKWLLKNFNGYIDIFLIGPILILLIMPVNAMGLEWFSIVLLLCGGRKDKEMEEKKVEKTFQKLKTSFICISSFMFLVWFTRICLHWWTAHLGGLLADSTPNFWCEDTGKRTNHKNKLPCILLDINSAVLMTYLIATIILYILTYAFLLRLGCCPTCCDKEA